MKEAYDNCKKIFAYTLETLFNTYDNAVEQATIKIDSDIRPYFSYKLGTDVNGDPCYMFSGLITEVDKFRGKSLDDISQIKMEGEMRKFSIY